MQNFDEYIIQGEPSQKEKAQIWQTAIGLQDVDGLKPSEYLLEMAKENIENKITINEVQRRIDSYYKQQSNRENIETERTEEADKVSARITEILSNDTFSFSPFGYIEIHRRLFTGIYKFAGKIRDYNISKEEWVLNGKSVIYSDYVLLRQTLDYDFAQEKQFDYQQIDFLQSVQHIVKFISGLWQIHAFGEGNTRTTAVFAIKYLRSFGFEINNKPFVEHSWYFRNALVRANYNDLKSNIKATTEYLMRFFGNLLFGEKNELKNRYLHVNSEDRRQETEGNDTVKFKNDTVNDTVFSLIQKDNKITAAKLAEQLGIGIATVKRELKRLKDSGKIERIGSDKTGEWKVVIR
jgi:fido (protein-threonine AMPylation protein)